MAHESRSGASAVTSPYYDLLHAVARLAKTTKLTLARVLKALDALEELRMSERERARG